MHFAGALTDLDQAFAAANVVLLTSRTEGLPRVLIEAGIRGLPVVATDVGYVRDIVIDGETGIVVDTPSPVALAAAIARAGENSSALGRGSRRLK